MNAMVSLKPKARKALSTGCIDSFGYHEGAAGWVFFGWVSNALIEPREAFQVTAEFSNGIVSGSAVVSFYNRSDIGSGNVGLAIFILGENYRNSALKSLYIISGDMSCNFVVAELVNRHSFEKIADDLHDLLAANKLVGNSQPVVSILRYLSMYAHAVNPAQPRKLVLVAPAANDLADGEFDDPVYVDQHPALKLIAQGHQTTTELNRQAVGRDSRQAVADESQPAKLSETRSLQSANEQTCSITGKLGNSNIEAVMLSTSGVIFVVGWTDDRFAPIQRLSVDLSNGTSCELTGKQLARFRRPDAERALGLEHGLHLGFCALLKSKNSSRGEGVEPQVVRLFANGGTSAEFAIVPRMVSDIELRDMMLSYFASAEFLGNKNVECFYALDGHFGQAIIDHNREISKLIISAATIERFDNANRRFKASIIVCLYGKPEFQFIQNALFAAGPGSSEYEFIYVCNSPELLESICNAALISQRIYGLNVTIVMLPGNAGFGAANNIAARYARSDRLMITNPDVFPMDRDWCIQHEALLEQLPANQSDLFGARLHYADGSLMHAGMYVDVDRGLSVSSLEIRRRSMLRVEHYGKGSHRDTPEFRLSRPVRAISGAFMSVKRRWFERLGGFAEDYVFGHYEDADLCLRSQEEGVTPWVHDLNLWHMEGQGSSRAVHHEGASLVNRWLFTNQWHQRLIPDSLGRATPPAQKRLEAML